MYYGEMPWIKWFSGEYDDYNQAKLKVNTPEEIKRKYEEYKKKKKEDFEKRELIY